MPALTALADPTRRQIIEMLALRELTAGEIVKAFPLTAPAISQHLKVLREARLIKVRVEGQKRIQSLNPEGLAEIEAWTKRMRTFWEGRLDALEQELKRERHHE